MPFARRIQNPEGLYFVTFATVQWVDVFTRSPYVDILLDSLRYCQKEKGLRIHAWCIMSNHVHLMISTRFGHHPSDALRDVKGYYKRKKNEGKPGLLVLNNIKNKIVHQILAVVRSQVPYDPDFVHQRAAA